ncbi:MAG TPA: DUF4438 domain-containing protein, partial [Planctomycetota bacterium]|nr:DUF4438 domain-containing protein [Planctomycetota bacterium]
MIKTNLEKLVEMAVSGEICHPSACGKGERVAFDGGTGVAVGSSGINFTVKMGDPAFDWASGDQVEPGVGIAHGCEDANSGLALYACIGNDAVITEACFEGKDAKLKGTPGV